MPDNYVESMPCDPDLLANLGRVTWASARLHAGVRDAINVHNGRSSDEPFSLTLGQAVAKLESLAQAAGRLDQVDWAKCTGRPAVKRRNLVIHGVTFTAGDGRQAIGTMDHSPPGRFLDDDLREVVLTLVHASMSLPR